MTAELEKAFDDVEVELFAEGKGIFDVIVDGELIYSKYKTDRFPDSGEITRLMTENA